MTLTHLSLFSGIGGIDLAADQAGFQTIAQVEQNDYCRKILEKHWPGVPRFNDVRDVTADALRSAGIALPTLISGGFPCQPFSCAGKRRGSDDDRFLWPEMLRIVQELRPAWMLGENVAGFVSMALDEVSADLEREGYQVRAFLVPAAGVGAPHRRDRCFIVAHSSIARSRGLSMRSGGSQSPQTDSYGESEDVADSKCFGGSQCGATGRDGGMPQSLPWDRAGEDVPEPCIRGVPDGVLNRVHRLRALGNAVVPAQVYPFLKAIADIEATGPAA